MSGRYDSVALTQPAEVSFFPFLAARAASLFKRGGIGIVGRPQFPRTGPTLRSGRARRELACPSRLAGSTRRGRSLPTGRGEHASREGLSQLVEMKILPTIPNPTRSLCPTNRVCRVVCKPGRPRPEKTRWPVEAAGAVETKERFPPRLGNLAKNARFPQLPQAAILSVQFSTAGIKNRRCRCTRRTDARSDFGMGLAFDVCKNCGFDRVMDNLSVQNGECHLETGVDAFQ